MNSNVIRLELGESNRPMDGWITLDISKKAIITCDVTKEKLPFLDNSVTEIYHSHFLEHFSYPYPMLNVLKECYRVLMPAGIMRVAVPDASIYIRSYINNEPFPEIIPVYKPAFFYNSSIDSINYIAYMAGQHKHCFDLDNLLAILKISGFTDVKSREYDPNIDVEKRRAQSIYAICHKPS